MLQVVGNLLSNAFRATPDGGRISLALAQQNGTVHVAVEDSGPGISLESRERLFRPFVSDSTGGTGLGLAIAKEISGALGGRIELESEVGQGRGSSSCCLPAAGLYGAVAQAHDVRGLGRERASIRSSRAFIARQPSVSSSTSSARSSTRALRSESIVASSGSSRRMALFERPLTSARRREIGAASSRRLPSAPRGLRGAHLVHTPKLPSASDGDPRARLRPAAGADRPAAGRRRDESRLLVFDGRPARSSTTSSASCPGSCGRGSRSSTTRGSCRRGSRSSGRAARCCCSSSWTATCGRRSRARRGGCGRAALRRGGAARASRRGPLARAARAASRPAWRRCRRTSPSRSRTRSATRRSTRASGLGRGADGGPALHAGGAGAARRRARHAARRPRHVPAAARRGRRGAPHPRRAVRR